jgi:hypothetical protein
MKPFKTGEAAWAFMSLTRAQCEELVGKRWTGDSSKKGALLSFCAAPAQ